jgi:hypothetical protein
MPVVLGNSNADVLCCCGLAGSTNFDDLSIVVNAVLDVVSLAGPTHFETGFGAARTADLIRRAEATGARVVATGLNPGFLLDVLPVACAVLAVTPSPVRARRASELGTWGVGLLEAFGIGCSPDRATDPPYLTPKVAVHRDAMTAGQASQRSEQLKPLGGVTR